MIPLLIVLLSWIAIDIDVADAFYARGDPALNGVKNCTGAPLDPRRTSIQGR